MKNDIQENIKSKSRLRTVHIHSLNKKGLGVGETETGGTLTVPFTLPGETVTAERYRKGGKLVEVIEPSSMRVEPKCMHFGTCGGCAWQHIEFQHQLDLKVNAIHNKWIEQNIDISKIPTYMETSQPFHYRNRMDFVWWWDGSFGLREKGKWHSVVNLEECWLLPSEVMHVALEINRRAQVFGLPFRDQKRKIPGLRYLVIRTGIHTGEIMLNVVSDTMDLPRELWDGLPQVCSVYQLINDNPTRDTSDGEPVLLFGKEGYEETILDHTFIIKPNVFFQPNPKMAEKMVCTVREWIANDDGPKQRFVDLYCGVGMFTVLLEDLFEKTVGIELVESSIELARRHAERRAIDFVISDAVDIDMEFLQDVDVLLVDPPREGLVPKVMKKILQTLPKRIVYVSCNPRKGVEDIAQLLEQYEIKQIAYFDQFPQTPHVEMIVMLALK